MVYVKIVNSPEVFYFCFRWTADSLLRCWPLHESTGRSYGNWSLLQECRRRNQVILISLFEKYDCTLCFASQIFRKICFWTYYPRLNHLKLSTPPKTKILIEARPKLFKSWVSGEKEISNTRMLKIPSSGWESTRPSELWFGRANHWATGGSLASWVGIWLYRKSKSPPSQISPSL